MADPSSTAALGGFVASWFTPTSLFLLLNLMIGTIFITSRFTTSAKHHHDSAPLARAPSSLIDRVKSINFFLYKFDHHPLQPESYSYQPAYPEAEPAHRADPPPLARAPSLMDRFMSMNFWHYHHHEEPDTGPTEQEYPAGVDPHPSLLQRLKSTNFSSYWTDGPNPESHPVQQRAQPVSRLRPEPPPLARAPSFLERVKSINFSLYGPENSYPEEMDPGHGPDHQVKRINSDTKSSGKKLPAKMKKSASDKSAFGHFGQEQEEDDVAEMRQPETVKEGRKKGADAEKGEEIDAKADHFINTFRQQLKLQRLDSIMRYKELITRARENHQ